MIFVLEIGTEELPARFLAPLRDELAAAFSAALLEADLNCQEIKVTNTPRRTIAQLLGLAEMQPLREEVVIGPAVKAAYDADGNPTKAAQGFARGLGLDVSALFVEKTEKGNYVAALKKTGGRAAADILPELCVKIISTLPFPKRMRWGSGSFAFARPIRWILALLNNKIVPFEIGNVQSGRLTYGHRVHGHGPFNVGTAEQLEHTLRDKGQVIFSAQERKTIITSVGNQLAKDRGARIMWKDSLIDEVVGLTEYPFPLLADFNPSYLELPKEVLLTSMESHQKSFGLENGQGLLPHFMTVLNIKPQNLAAVKQGWERVLRARLEDARFYWETDLKSDFNIWRAKLDHVIFLGPLGSMGDKCRRLAKLCAWLTQQPGVPAHDLREEAELAGLTAKADLVTQMVGEFDTLQGIMGGIYARKKNLPEIVAAALAEQYLPAGPDTPLPATTLGAILSLSDKADTLVGCFGLGKIPTGAADPYALRRAALGIARILKETGFRIDVKALFKQALSLYSGDIAWKLTGEESLTKLNEFFSARLRNFMGQAEDTLLVEAVLGADYSDVWAAARRLEALKAACSSPGFELTAQTFKRVTNILRKQEAEHSGQWHTGLLCEPAEQALAEAVRQISLEFDKVWASDDFSQALNLLAGIRPKVDDFFDQVMVMDENPDLRNNRLNLLRALLNKIKLLADFSALQM